MPTVRELDPSDAPALTALYEEYPWWDDRTVAANRRGEGHGETLIDAVVTHAE